MYFRLSIFIPILFLLGCTLEDQLINSTLKDNSFINQHVLSDSLDETEKAPTCELPLEIIPVYKNSTNEQFLKLLQGQIVYPKELCLHGTTVLCFTVDKKGNVLDPVIKRSLAGGIDTQLVHLIKQYEFTPGKINGEVAAFQMCFPFRIYLE